MATKQQQKDRETAVIRAPHDGSEVGVAALAGPEDVRAALDANVAAARAAGRCPLMRGRPLCAKSPKDWKARARS
jgi:acyl-CoA reductase-like NAD-dependent aldehyde dehydrogenase